MSAFERVPDDWILGDLVDWIAGGDAKSLARLGDKRSGWIEVIVPTCLEDLDLECCWLRSAWEARGVQRVTARLLIALRADWHQDERGEHDELDTLGQPFEDWARKYATWLRRALLAPATTEQTTEALARLAEAVDQNLARSTATAIVRLIDEAGLPFYVTHAIFERVKWSEAGKIRPGSFNRLLAAARQRLGEESWLVREARDFVDHLEEALTLLHEWAEVEATGLRPYAPRRPAQESLGTGLSGPPP